MAHRFAAQQYDLRPWDAVKRFARVARGQGREQEVHWGLRGLRHHGRFIGRACTQGSDTGLIIVWLPAAAAAASV